MPETTVPAGSSTNYCGCDVMLSGKMSINIAVSIAWQIVSVVLRLQLEFQNASYK
jgi:hypothetical protein